jgi:hypothetical protein
MKYRYKGTASKLCASGLDETQIKASPKTGKHVSSVKLVSCKVGESEKQSKIM